MANETHRLLRFNLIARASILINASLTVVLAWAVPTSLTARLIADGSTYGRLTLVALTVTVALGWIDALINDVLPERFALTFTLRRRHSLYHVLAGLYFIQAFAGVGDSIDAEDLLSLGYMCNGAIAAWYSWSISLRGTHA